MKTTPPFQVTVAISLSILVVIWPALGVVSVRAVPPATQTEAELTDTSTPPILGEHPSIRLKSFLDKDDPINKTTDIWHSWTPVLDEPQTARLRNLQSITGDKPRTNRSVGLEAAERVMVTRQKMATEGRLDESLQQPLGTQQTNFRGVHAILSISEIESHRPNLTKATRRAKVGLKLQVAQLNGSTRPTDPTGVTLPATQKPSYPSPGAATFAILDKHNVTPTAEQATNIRSLNNLPEPIRSELTDLLNAHLAYERSTRQTYTGLKYTEVPAMKNRPTRFVRDLKSESKSASKNSEDKVGGPLGQPVAASAARVNSAQIRAAQIKFLESSVDLRSTFEASEEPGLATPTSDPGTVEVPGVVSINLLSHNNTYETDYALQIDVGGNDTYNNTAGGGFGEAAALIDMEGEDSYQGLNGGGALTGAGFLLDAGTGSDTYTSGSFGTNGGGAFLGVGFLLDTGGSDAFTAEGLGTNGGGIGRGGQGLLLDISLGDDTFVAGDGGTNGGGFKHGQGLLISQEGQDTYEAGGAGTNGGGDAGFGALIDITGGDTYVAKGDSLVAPHGTNGGAHQGTYGGGQPGVGLLLDGTSGDRYRTTGINTSIRGTNGGGSNNSIGTLLDESGYDVYRAEVSEVQNKSVAIHGANGGVVDGGIGTLLDPGYGDDTYKVTASVNTTEARLEDTDANVYGANGGTFSSGSGILVDYRWTDSYNTTANGTTKGVNGGVKGQRTQANGFGLLWDRASIGDSYVQNNCNNGNPVYDDTWAPKGATGAQIDIVELEREIFDWRPRTFWDFLPSVPNVGVLRSCENGLGGEISGQWPMFNADFTNKGHINTTGPTSNITESWNFTTGSSVGDVDSSPAVVNGIVYVGSRDGKVYALDAQTGGEIWHYTTGGEVFSSPAVVNGIVYVGSRDGNVYALDARTGGEIWHFTTGDSLGGVSSSPAVVNGTVYVGSNDNTLYALDASTGYERWHFTSGGDLSSSPAVATAGYENDTVFIGSEDGNVYALDAETGVMRWRFKLVPDSSLRQVEVISSPAVVNGIVYLSGFDGRIYALDATTGGTIWTTHLPGKVVSSPAVVDGIVYIGTLHGRVYGLDTKTGIKRPRFSTFSTGDDVFSSPAVVNGTVYFGNSDNRVYAIDAKTGSKRWDFTTDGDVFSSPAVVNGTVYIGSKNGTVYALVEK